MNTTRTVQVQRNTQTAARVQATVPVARFMTPSPATATSVRYAPRPAESIHSARDGHWAVYMFVAALCLAGTIFISSSAAQGMLDRLIQ